MASSHRVNGSTGTRPNAEAAPPDQVGPAVGEIGLRAEPDGENGGRGRQARRVARQLLLTPAAVAVVVWLVATPLAFLAVRTLDLDPLTSRGALMPMSVGLLLVGVLAVTAVRGRTPLLAGAAAGAGAAWVELCLASAYVGTPFGDSGLRGDAARFTALVTRYTVTLQPVDAFVPSVPTEYPPLFPWLIARIANLAHRPGWTLVGDAQALLMSVTVLAGFLLWQRLIPAWPALMLAITAPLAFGQPRKVYEIFTMAVVVPCALAALSRFRRPGGLHWLPAGLVLGVILQVYQGYLLFTAAGLVALAVMGWRNAGSDGGRRSYVLHVAGIVGTSLVVAAWYLVPFVHGLLTIRGSRVNDVYVAGEITADPFAVHRLLDPPLAPLTIIGLLGLLALRGRRWWATPLLALMAGSYLYRMIFLVVFVATGHTGYLDYTGRVVSMLLLTGGVLTVWTTAPVIGARLRRRFPPGIGIACGAVFAATAMFLSWQLWTPAPVGLSDQLAHPIPEAPNLAMYAHAEPLPNGRLPRFHPAGVTVAWFPTARIEAAVERHLGPDAEPVTVSYNEKLFAFLPWPAYVAVERQASNTYTHWDDRVAELRSLSELHDPAAFAAAAKRTRFGGIDVFVLHVDRGSWGWGPLRFDPTLFTSAYWWVVQLPNATVVAVRR